MLKNMGKKLKYLQFYAEFLFIYIICKLMKTKGIFEPISSYTCFHKFIWRLHSDERYMMSENSMAPHARIQEFSSGGGGGESSTD